MLVAKKDLEYYYPEQVNIEENPPRKIKKKKKKSNAAAKLAIMGIAMIGLIISLFILYRYANISKMRLEITELEKQRVELEREKEDLVAELEGVKSSSKIEEDAIIKLGMEYPTEEQVVYVEVEELTLAEETDVVREFTLVKQLKSVMNLVLSLF